MADDKTLHQAREQCRVVAHLARALAEIHEDRVRLYDACPDNMRETVFIDGPRSAAIMESLGDMLNGMDAAMPEDEWTTPIFQEAQRLWPTENEGASER